jgi:Na+/melibiose symporter-like transporter
MAVYICLAFLVLGLVTLAWDNHSDRQHRAVQFGVAVMFVAFAAIVMIGSAIRSLWLYPLS